MSRPKISSKERTLTMLPGEARSVYIMQCGWCGSDIEVDADSEQEAQAAFVEQGVREVDTDDVTGLFCSECVESARKNRLEE